MKQKSGTSQVESSEDHRSSSQSESTLPDVSQQSTTPVNADEVEELVYYGVDEGAIALLLGCSTSQLTSEFADAVAHGRARQQQFLLEKLADRIEANEWPPLRFALKNVLGMADNPEQAALQRRKLAQLREQGAARTAELSPLPPPAAAVGTERARAGAIKAGHSQLTGAKKATGHGAPAPRLQ